MRTSDLVQRLQIARRERALESALWAGTNPALAADLVSSSKLETCMPASFSIPDGSVYHQHAEISVSRLYRQRVFQRAHASNLLVLSSSPNSVIPSRCASIDCPVYVSALAKKCPR
jgi:hypothetical protein